MSKERRSKRLRLNMDPFKGFNVRGLNNPGCGDGTLSFKPQYSSSHNTPRQIQLTLRLEL